MENKVITSTYFFVFVLIGIMSSTAASLLPTISQITGASLGKVGLIFSLRSFGFMLGTAGFGFLFDKFKGHRLLAFSAFFTAAVLSCIANAVSWTLMALLFILYGLIESGLDTGGNTLLAWLHKEKVAPYMSALHFFYGTGALLGPLLVSYSLERNIGFTKIYLLQALLLILVVPLFLLTKSPKKLCARKENKSPTSKKFLVTIFVFLFLFYCGAEVAFGGWIFSISTLELHSTATAAGLITSSFWISFTSGRFTSVFLSRKFSNEKILSCTISCAAVVILLACYLPFTVTNFFIISILFGGFMGPIFPTSMALAQEKFNLSGKITSLFLVGSSIGIMTLPGILGFIVEKAGTRYALFGIFVNLFFALVALYTIKKSNSVPQLREKAMALEN